MMAEMPVFVARRNSRPVSAARIRVICKCWCGAALSPNQASLLTFTSRFAAGKALRTSLA